MKLFGWLAAIGALVAASATTASYYFIFDEPEMPESLL